LYADILLMLWVVLLCILVGGCQIYSRRCSPCHCADDGSVLL